MSKVIITKEGLLTLAEILISCRPLHVNPEELKNKLFIHKKASLISSETDYNEMINDLPVPTSAPVYNQIRDFSKNFQGRITPEVLWEFFASDIHIEKIFGDFKSANLDVENPKVLSWLISHTLLPVHLKKSNGKEFKAQYNNGDLSVFLSGLVLPKKNKKIDFEKFALVHCATIIALNCSKEQVQHFLSGQAKNRNFMKACQKVEKIDYRKFPLGDLTSWTKKRFAKLKK